MYSRLLNGLGRHDEAVAEIKLAIDLEPASVFNHRLLGVAYYYARRYDEAIEQFERVIKMDRTGPTIMWLSQTLGQAGRDEEAFKLWIGRFTDLIESDRREWQAAFEREGWKGIMRERARRFENSTEIYTHGAAYHAYVGDADKALAYLETALERRENMLQWLRVDPRFDPIRNEPRFEAFLAKTGL